MLRACLAPVLFLDFKTSLHGLFVEKTLDGRGTQSNRCSQAVYQITRPKVKKDALKYFPCIPEECPMYPKYLLMSFVLHSLK